MDLAQAPLLNASARRFAWTSFSLALVLRLAFTALFLAKGLDVAYGRDLYHSMALNWLGWGPVYPFDATHPPLYSAFIAVILRLFGSPSQIPVLIIQCVLGAGSVPLTRLIGARLGLPEAVARLAALWVAFDPGLIFYAPQLGTETLFVFMELVFFAGLLAQMERPLSPRLTAVGLWGGLMALCRSMIGGYPAFLFAFLWRAKGLARAFLFCAALGVGWLAPTMAWSVRNYLKYDRVVPVAAQMGWNLYEGFTLDREEVRRRPHEMDAEATRLGIEGNVERGDYFAKKTVRFARENPLAAAKIVAGKAFLFWRPLPYDPHTGWQRWGLCAYFTALFALALYGGASGLFKDRAWAPVWALFIYMSVLHSVFFTSLRYRLPLEPFLCLLASAGFAQLLRRRRA